jgi:hypothetical protein
MADDEPLDPVVEVLVLPELRSGQCIDGWTVLPNDDLLVFLIDYHLQQAVAPFVMAAGPPRLGCGDTLVFAQEGGRWVRVGAGSWVLGPDRLLRTFELAAREAPHPAWEAGAGLCRRWLGWYAQPGSQVGVDELLAEMDAEPVHCPIWREMRRQFARWARVRGFRAPEVVHAAPGAPSEI